MSNANFPISFHGDNLIEEMCAADNNGNLQTVDFVRRSNTAETYAVVDTILSKIAGVAETVDQHHVMLAIEASKKARSDGADVKLTIFNNGEFNYLLFASGKATVENHPEHTLCVKYKA